MILIRITIRIEHKLLSLCITLIAAIACINVASDSLENSQRHKFYFRKNYQVHMSNITIMILTIPIVMQQYNNNQSFYIRLFIKYTRKSYDPKHSYAVYLAVITTSDTCKCSLYSF